MLDFNKIKIHNSNLDMLPLIVTETKTQSIEKVDVVDTKPTKWKRKNKKPVLTQITQAEREQNLLTLTDEINEIDEDTENLKYTHKECVNKIVDFIKDNYVNEKKELKI